MPPLPDELRARLPPLYSQEAEDEPYIYACFTLPGTSCAWYVMDGEPDGSDFLFSGFISGQQNEFGHFRLSELESLRSPTGTSVELDHRFTEGRLTDVVPAPD